MPRYIDADAFIKMMEEKCDHTASLDEWVLAVCRGGIKAMPTVEVIRCKDCKWFHSDKHQCSRQICASFNDDDFCSYAERRTDE